MSSEFLLRNRLSDFSSASYSSNHNDNNHNDDGFSPAVIGHDYASNILVAELAIRSTAFNAGSTPPSTNDNKKLNETSAEKEKDHGNGKKTKRRVTFNLDNVQVQTIPIYSSCSSEDSSESEQEDEDFIYSLPTNNDVAVPSSSPPSLPSPPLSSSQLTPPIPQPENTVISEQIFKKESYDALQQRKQVRHRDTSNHLSSISKPGYWYPLNPSKITGSSTNGGMARCGSPLPALRSLEMTERLITETIEREMALNPHILNHATAKTDSYTQQSCLTATPPKSPIVNNSAVRVSMLITDTDDEDEDDDDYGDNEESTQEKLQDRIDKTEAVINDEQPNSRHSPELFFSVLIDGEQDSDPSIATSSAELQDKYSQDRDQSESNFTKSVYDELAKRHDQSVLSFPEHDFSFEQDVIPIPANNDVVVIPPPQNNDNRVWVDNPTPIAIHDQAQTRDLFFVRVLKAENLDFPIDNDNTDIYCNIQYKNTESRSHGQKMAHTMMIDHEMRIQDIDPNEQIAITIHVAAATQNSKKTQLSTSSWYHRIKASSDLQRYVHEKDGSICQTLFSPDRFMANVSIDQTASLMLVNNWYRPVQHTMSPSSSSSLLLRKTSTLMKKKPVVPAAAAKEKAVGKLYVQCLYIKIQGNRFPRDLNEAVEALNAKRFHNTVWQSGHLLQLGGNAKQPQRRYFELTGGCLYAYADAPNKNEKDNRPLYKIPLPRAIRLICDNFVILERSESHLQTTNPATLVNQLEQVIMLDDEEGKYYSNNADQEKNSFQLVFDNGDKIHFGCASFEERNKWVSVMEIIICRLPLLPNWIMN
ncbi:hypothetical protein [Parasitella parasitica]|uniref:PH domain-containing protein n=1 Tax=Parasitella parasitica TaxID=35722 RepID=A0A0B7MXT8_9FUNG|nr:hypothetical protein [Parasitella parasitica]